MLLLATACAAQSSSGNGSSHYHWADIVLTSPPVDSELECYQTDTAPDAIAVRVWSSYTLESCHNIASVFSEEQNREGNATCQPGSPQSCPEGFLPSLAENYSPETNYSYIRFQHASQPRREEIDYSNFTLKVFPQENCEEGEEIPWFSWGGCEEQEESCNELPYGVASFRLELTAEEELGECRLAAEQGESARIRTKEANLVGATLAVVGLLMFW